MDFLVFNLHVQCSETAHILRQKLIYVHINIDWSNTSSWQNVTVAIPPNSIGTPTDTSQPRKPKHFYIVFLFVYYKL